MADPNGIHLSGLWFADGRASEHWHLAFEAYGHAMACASALELQLGLTVLKAMATGKSKDRTKFTSDQLMKYGEEVRLKTFPKLIVLASRHFTITRDPHEGLLTAKKARDYLAHNFWQANVGNLSDEEGADLIAAQCGIDAWHFLELSRDFAFETQIDVSDFISQTYSSSKDKRKEWRQFVDKWLEN